MKCKAKELSDVIAEIAEAVKPLVPGIIHRLNSCSETELFITAAHSGAYTAQLQKTTEDGSLLHIKDVDGLFDSVCNRVAIGAAFLSFEQGGVEFFGSTFNGKEIIEGSGGKVRPQLCS